MAQARRVAADTYKQVFGEGGTPSKGPVPGASAGAAGKTKGTCAISTALWLYVCAGGLPRWGQKLKEPAVSGGSRARHVAMPEAGFGALCRCCVVVACGLCAEPTTALGRILQRTKKATAAVSPVSGAASTVKGATDGTRSRADVHIWEPVGAQRD